MRRFFTLNGSLLLAALCLGCPARHVEPTRPTPGQCIVTEFRTPPGPSELYVCGTVDGVFTCTAYENVCK